MDHVTSHDENVPFQCSKSGSRDLNATLNPQNLIPSPVSFGFATNRFQILLFPGNLKVQFFFERGFIRKKKMFFFYGEFQILVEKFERDLSRDSILTILIFS